MTTLEKILHHRIHPIKPAIDWVAGFVALWLLRKHRVTAALFVTIVPPEPVSAALIRWSDLERQRKVPPERGMPGRKETLRLAGHVVMAMVAWY